MPRPFDEYHGSRRSFLITPTRISKADDLLVLSKRLSIEVELHTCLEAAQRTSVSRAEANPSLQGFKIKWTATFANSFLDTGGEPLSTITVRGTGAATFLTR
jgi:hypothetical protein